MQNNFTEETKSVEGRILHGIQSEATVSTSQEVEHGAFRALLPFCIIVFLCYFSLGLAFGALPSYLHGTLSLSARVVGWMIGLQSIATVLTRGLAGRLTDGKGAKRSILAGAGVLVLAAVAISATELPTLPVIGTLILLVIGRVALGLAESFVMTGALSGSVAAVGVKRAGLAMVWIGIALFAGIATGAPVGARIVNNEGLTGIGLLSLLSAIGVAVIGLLIRHFPRHAGQRQSFLTVLGTIWPYGISLGFSTVGYAALLSFLTLDYQTKGWEGAPLCISAFSIAYILARLVLGHLPDRVGGYRVIAITLPLQAVGFCCLGLATSPTMALTGAAIAGAGYALTFPACGVEAVRHVLPQNRGAAMGAYVAFIDIGLGATGPAGGLLVASKGYPSIFLASAALSIVALIVANLAKKSKQDS